MRLTSFELKLLLEAIGAWQLDHIDNNSCTSFASEQDNLVFHKIEHKILKELNRRDKKQIEWEQLETKLAASKGQK